MLRTAYIGLFTSVFLCLPAVVQENSIQVRLIHYERSAVIPAPEPFLEDSDAQGAAWNRIVESCTPIDSRSYLSEVCLSRVEEYFLNEPVWAYSKMYYYNVIEGWVQIVIREFAQRTDHSYADYINEDVPLWRDIFDGQIEKRQDRFLEIVEDPSCKELARFNTPLGIDENKSEQCAARELYKYAAYLNACNNAEQRLSFLQQSYFDESSSNTLNRYDESFQLLDEWVSDVALRSSAKLHLQKFYLLDYWVNEQCKKFGYKFVPDIEVPLPFQTNENKTVWGRDLEEWLLNRTHQAALTISAKSSDDWAIRSYPLGGLYTSAMNQDVMKEYPLLMHRILGKSANYFTPLDRARHKAKAYLLLVERAGLKIARLEYDPKKLKKEIRYVENGGMLRPPLSHVDATKKLKSRFLEREENRLLKEMQGELF